MVSTRCDRQVFLVTMRRNGSNNSKIIRTLLLTPVAIARLSNNQLRFRSFGGHKNVLQAVCAEETRWRLEGELTEEQIEVEQDADY